MSSPAPTVVRPDADDAVTAALRTARRERLFRAMAAHDLDVVVLSRPANVVYATGARQLWTAGTRPVGPACVAVGATRRTHLLSVTADGVPAEISHDDLVGPSWNPDRVWAALRSIPRLTDARTVGTDTSSPGLPPRLAAVAPDADVVDANPAIWAARTTKTEAEVAGIAKAVGVADAGLAAMRDALAPGVTERALVGVYLERVASLGAPTPPTEGVVCATAAGGPVALRRVATGRPVTAGELVVLDAGAVVAGYEGGVGRTYAVASAPNGAQLELAARCRGALDAVLEVCRAGATTRDVLDAWHATGEALPPVPLVHGVGLGMEPPLIGAAIDDDAVLVAGSVLSVTAWVAREHVGGWLERDVIVVGEGAPTVVRAGAGCGNGP